MRAWAMEILEDMAEMEQNLGLSDGVLDTMRIRVEHPETTYAARQVADIEDQGFLGSQMKKAREYKAESQGRENILREYGDADEIYSNPQTEYTKKLIQSIPNVLN